MKHTSKLNGENHEYWLQTMTELETDTKLSSWTVITVLRKRKWMGNTIESRDMRDKKARMGRSVQKKEGTVGHDEVCARKERRGGNVETEGRKTRETE